MKICRVTHKDLEGPRYAVALGSNVFPLAADFNFDRIEMLAGQAGLPLDEVKLLAPVAPSMTR